MGKNILPIILIVLAVGIYFTYTSGKINDINDVKAQSATYQSALSNFKNLITIREKVRDARKQISDDDIDRLNKMIPDNIDNVRLIIDVNGIAARHGVTLRGVRTSAGDAIKTTGGAKNASVALTPVTITFGVSTTYDNFISLMQDVERSLRVMDVSHVSLNANDGGVYDYSVEVKTYWLKQ